MNGALELNVYRLIFDATIFTKIIILFLACISVFSWAVMIQKFFFLNEYKKQLAKFVKAVTSQQNPAYIEESCEKFSNGPVKVTAVILLRLIRLRRQGKLTMHPQAVLNNSAMHEANRLKQGMNMLATTANISPLIGLLGTVWGVMYAFMNIGQEGSASIGTVAPGIAEALMTTIAGLLVAIPAMAGHNFLSGWINLCLDYLDRITEFGNSILEER